MKTIRFDCNGHNAPAYSCDKPYDNSGEYVPADVAQGLYAALEDAASLIRSTLILLECDDEFIARETEKARAALKKAKEG